MQKLMGLFLVSPRVSLLFSPSFCLLPLGAWLLGLGLLVATPATANASDAAPASTAGLLQTFSFQPTVTLWLCPKGALYPIMQCKPAESAQPKVDLTLQPVGNDANFFQGSWEVRAPGNAVFQSVLVTSFVHEANGPILLIHAGAGFEEEMARHAGVFMEVSQAGIPKQIMTTGDRIAVNQSQEVVVTLELNEIEAR